MCPSFFTPSYRTDFARVLTKQMATMLRQFCRAPYRKASRVQVQVQVQVQEFSLHTPRTLATHPRHRTQLPEYPRCFPAPTSAPLCSDPSQQMGGGSHVILRKRSAPPPPLPV